MSLNTTCPRCGKAVSGPQQATLLAGRSPQIPQHAGHTQQQVTQATGPNRLMILRTTAQLCTRLLLISTSHMAPTLVQAAAAAGAEDHQLLPMTSWRLLVISCLKKLIAEIYVASYEVHICFIHICFVLVTVCGADMPWCAHFSSDLTPSRITQQISVEKCSHQGATACREHQQIL